MRVVEVAPGPPRRAVLASRPEPTAPRGTEVLVRVAASSVNGTDLHLVRGALPTVPGRGPARLGFDVAGDVVACGPRVTSVGVGDRVVALLGHGGGGQADLVLVPQHAVTFAPQTVTPAHGAALPLAGLTALQALRGRAAVGAGTRVLVIGAAGGIGSFVVQLARLAGARVSAAAGGDRAEFLRRLGADEVIDSRRDDLLGSGERWDVVVDTPSVYSFTSVRSILTRDGVMVSTRPVSLDALRFVVTRPPGRSGPRFRVVMTRPSGLDLARLVRLVDTGRLTIPIDRVLPLAEVAAAHARVVSGNVQGKVVLET